MKIVKRAAILMIAAAVSISSLPLQVRASEDVRDRKHIASLLNLEEESYSADFSDLTASELSSVSLKRIFSEVEELESASKVALSLDGGNSYKIVSPEKKVNLINVSTVEIIIGNLDQLDAENNVKKIAKIDFNWVNPTVYAIKSSGEKVLKSLDEAGVNDNLFDTEENKYIYINTGTNQYDEKVNIGFEIGGSPSGKVKFYEGYFTKEKIAKRAKDITSLLWGNSEYEMRYGESRDVTMVTYDSDGSVVTCFPIELLVTATNDETEKFNISLSADEGEDVVRNLTLKKTGASSFEASLELYKGYSKFDSYLLSISGRNNTVQSVYEGKYSSLDEARKSGYPNIEELVTGDGYVGEYGNGVWFTIFSQNEDEENESHQILVKAERGVRSREELSSSTKCEFLELVGDGSLGGTLIEGDSYQKKNFITFLVDENTSLSNIALSFRTEGDAKVQEKLSGNEVFSGETTFDFSNGPIGFTITSENGENEADYFVRVIRKQSGAKLYVNTLTDSQLMAGGSLTSNREIVFSDYFSYNHDIILANIGSENLANLNVSLSSSELTLDDYWNLNGNGTLPAIEDSSEDLKLAKLRIKAKDGFSKGTRLSGTLTISSNGSNLMVLNLNGVVGDAEITTKSLPGGTLYTLYNATVTGSSNVDGNLSTYEVVRGSLPDGLEMNSDGSITGLPREKGSYSFTVRMNNSSPYLGKMEKEFAIQIFDNTNTNIAKEVDKGYEITQKIETINVDTSKKEEYTMVSKGEFSEFKDLYLDGRLLIRDEEYTAKEGSTILTIFANVLKEALGRRTMSAIFENKKSGELKTAVLNVKVISNNTKKLEAERKSLSAKKKAVAVQKKRARLAKKRREAERKQKAEAERKRKAYLARKKAEAEKKRKALLAKKKALLKAHKKVLTLKPNTELDLSKVEWTKGNTQLYKAKVKEDGYQRFKLKFKSKDKEKKEEALTIILMDKKFQNLDKESFKENHTFGNFYYKKGETFYILLKKNKKKSVYKDVFFAFETIADKKVEKENNNSEKKANLLNDSLMGSIHRTDGNFEDVDYFKYQAKKTGYILLKLPKLNGKVEISISAKDKPFWARKIGKATKEGLIIPVKKGEYFFKIAGVGGKTPVLNYQLEVKNKKSKKYETESNQSYKEPSQMNRLASLDSKFDIDVFQMKVTKAGKYKAGIEFPDSKKPHSKIKAATYVNGKLFSTREGNRIGTVLWLKKGAIVTVVMTLKDNSNIGTPYKLTFKKIK